MGMIALSAKLVCPEIDVRHASGTSSNAGKYTFRKARSGPRLMHTIRAIKPGRPANSDKSMPVNGCSPVKFAATE
jgi:hypothetical protein